MELIFKRALWVTFLLYLGVSFVNTAGLASHFEPNWWICNIWSLAVEIGEITLLIGTLKRKRDGKSYIGYLATFLVSLAVSIAANVLEWTNSFLGNDIIYQGLHQFEYPWVVPALLGITIPALMLATGSMISDMESIPRPNSILDNNIQKEETIPKNNGEVNHGLSVEQPTFIETVPAVTVEINGKNGKSPSQRRENVPSQEEFFVLSAKELAQKYNVSEKTIRNWRKKNTIINATIPV